MARKPQIDDTLRTRQLHLSDRFTRAVDYARVLHIERRKGTDIPYMAHLLGVAAIVLGEAGHADVSEDMVIAAVLHDAAEDHGGQLRLDDIERNFGAEVAHLVESLSDSLAEEGAKKAPWMQRKEEYLKRLRKEPADVLLISAADKLYNARAILDDYRKMGPAVWRRFKRGRKHQLRYFRELLKVFKAAGESRIVAELERVTDKLERISANEKQKG